MAGEMVSDARLEVRLLAEPFDAAGEIARFSASYRGAGGIASFIGQVRQGAATSEDGPEVEALELRHYAPLTLPGMRALGEAAMGRWPLEGLLILHRTGLMLPGDPIVLVCAAARHRREAFAAADFVMDHLKSESWFWKREKVGGAWRWIEPRPEDYADIARWC